MAGRQVEWLAGRTKDVFRASVKRVDCTRIYFNTQAQMNAWKMSIIGGGGDDRGRGRAVAACDKARCLIPVLSRHTAAHCRNGHERPRGAADTRTVGLPRAPGGGEAGAGGCVGGGGGGGAGGDGGGGHDVAAHIRWHRRLRQPRGLGGASPSPVPTPSPPADSA